MSTLLLHLRQVPDDEADAVRALLADADIAFYETRASIWGISPGSLWLKHETDLPAARALMADMQTRRRDATRAARDAAVREGTAETFGTTLRQHPLRVAVTLLAIVFFAALTAWPFVML